MDDTSQIGGEFFRCLDIFSVSWTASEDAIRRWRTDDRPNGSAQERYSGTKSWSDDSEPPGRLMLCRIYYWGMKPFIHKIFFFTVLLFLTFNINQLHNFCLQIFFSSVFFFWFSNSILFSSEIIQLCMLLVLTPSPWTSVSHHFTFRQRWNYS